MQINEVKDGASNASLAYVASMLPGTTREDAVQTYGLQKSILVYNNTGSAIAAGLLVKWVDGVDGLQVGLAANNDEPSVLAGITLGAIPTGLCGWACYDGLCLGTAGGGAAVTVATAIQSAGSGAIKDNATAGIACGWSAAAILASATGAVRISLR